ncbi:helix-turn-helix domain-containing protein [Methylobacillus gramineus]|uniref:helix-turn-helix domain-containing protein n=1 Tax=Methylobacillus gramineus TaxID=755169 RepID=UPI001CFF8020|nr:helix-turn-helix transcriptional regulator [Methylobacillus gramineus]MCB5185005.1 helix-turn-helix domain-containing protein [Methylobacillus gramineus]
MKLETKIANRLKEARLEAGLSLEALGVAVGIEEATAKVRIHQYEAGKHAPPFSMIERLAEVLGKPLVWFICSEDEKSLYLNLSKVSAKDRPQLLDELEALLKSGL